MAILWKRGLLTTATDIQKNDTRSGYKLPKRVLSSPRRWGICGRFILMQVVNTVHPHEWRGTVCTESLQEYAAGPSPHGWGIGP